MDSQQNKMKRFRADQPGRIQTELFVCLNRPHLRNPAGAACYLVWLVEVVKLVYNRDIVYLAAALV